MILLRLVNLRAVSVASIAAAAVVVLGPGQIVLAAPVATSAISPAAATANIGENTTFTVTFDNTGPDTGYAPYLDVYLPIAGADNATDGVSFTSASFLGSPIAPLLITICTGASVTHPLTGLMTSCPVGRQLVVLQLPFGSFTPTQPAAAIQISAAVSNRADVGTPLTISSTPGFAYGDTPTGTTAVIGSNSTATVTPKVVTFRKVYVGPENETATGPNFPRRYRLEVDIATGATINNLTISDFLPSTMAFLSVISSGPVGAVATQTPTVGAPDIAPNNDLVRTFASVTGTSATTDAFVEFEYFIPQFKAPAAPVVAVISPTSGDDITALNDGRSGGTFPGNEAGDAVTFTINPDTLGLDNHLLNPKSIAIQKTSTLTTDAVAPGLTPGDTLTYSLQTQVSDFFTFGSVHLPDVLGDGQSFDASSATFSVTERGVTTTGTFTTGQNMTVNTSAHTCGNGTTVIDFDLSKALTDAAPGGALTEGVLTGGRVGGSFGGTSATITYRATVLDAYRCTAPPRLLDTSIDAGDTVANDVTVTGIVYDNATQTATAQSEDDTSAVTNTIVGGALTKEIYARNGVVGGATGSPMQYAAGETITYRLRYPLLSSDIEEFKLTDFLPLPVLKATDITTSPAVTAVCAGATVPASGSICYGPADTFHTIGISPDPAVAISASGNSVTLNYGTFDSPTQVSSQIDILFTLTISSDPFRDGLFLTNQAQADSENSFGVPIPTSSIAQIELTQPTLNLRKGVASTNRGDAVLTGAIAPTSRMWGAPGTTCANAITGGTVSTANRAGAPNADVANIDAGDTVRFAIIVENTGKGLNGAFDVAISDSIPAGFVVPSGGINLCVTDGTGATMATTRTGFFAGGSTTPGTLTLNDPGATATPGGALDPDNAAKTSGANLAIITYELEVAASIAPVQTVTNTASITGFSAVESGPNFAVIAPTATLTDTAAATSRPVTGTKSVTATSAGHSTGTSVVVGEVVTYTAVLTIPEGTISAAVISDTLPTGMAMVGVDSLTPTAGLTSSTGFPAGALSAAQASLSSPGSGFSIDLGTLTNTNRVNATPESITVVYRAVVLDVAAAIQGASLTNAIKMTYTGGQSVAAAAAVVVREPNLDITKTASPTLADAGDTVTYVIDIKHNAASTVDAFDVTLADVIPSGITYDAGSLSSTGLAPSASTPLTISSGTTISAGWDVFAVGAVARITYTATFAGANAAPGSVSNTANTKWTSLPGNVSGPLSPYNTASKERTGAGGVDSYTESSTATVSVPNPLITKDLRSTDQADTAGSNVTIGENATYDLKITLPEGSISGFVVTDRLPSGLQYVAGSAAVLDSAGDGTGANTLGAAFNGTLPVPAISGGTSNGDDLVFTFASTVVTADNVGNNNSIILRLQVTVLDVPGNVGVAPQTVFNNDATVQLSGGATVISNVVATRVVEPKMTISKAISPTTAIAGEQVTVTLTVRNTGLSIANEVIVDDDLSLFPGVYDLGTVLAASSDCGLSFAYTNPVVRYSGGTLAVGQTCILTFQVNVASPLTAGTRVRNRATVTQATTLAGVVSGERDEADVSADAEIGVVAPDLTVTKNDSDLNVLPGDTQIYSIVVRNGGGRDATGVTVTEAPPTGMSFVSVGGDARCVRRPLGSNIVDITGTLVAGTAVTCQFSLRVANPLTAGLVSFTNQVSVADDGLNGPESDTANNSAQDVDVKDASAIPVLTITKTDSKTVVAPGEELTYVVTVTNGGSVGASGVYVKDILPSAAAFVSCTTGLSTETIPCAHASGVVDATFSPVAGGGGQAQMTIVVRLPNPAPSSLDDVTNTVTVVDDGANGAEDQSDNSATDVDTVDAAPDMTISKSADLNAVAPGDMVAYSLLVANVGAQDAAGVRVVDTLPLGVSPVAGSISNAGVFNSLDRTITWGPPLADTGTGTDPFASGESHTFSYQLTIDDPVAADRHTFANSATVTDDASNGDDPTGAGDVVNNNTSTWDLNLILGPDGAAADLDITKTDADSDLRPGDTQTYTLVATNTGNIGASNVAITDTLPSEVTYVPGSCALTPSIGTCSVVGDTTLTVELAVLAGAGGTDPNSVTISYQVSVNDPQTSGTLQKSNSVIIDDDHHNGSDPTSANNQATDTDTLTAAPDLTITKDDGATSRVVGEQFDYTIVVSNVGDQDATGVTVTDVLPPELEFVSCDTGCSEAGPGQLTWMIGALAGGADLAIPPVGSKITLTVRVNVKSPLPAGVSTFANTASVDDDQSNGDDPTPGDNTSTDADEVVAMPDMTITKTDNVSTVIPGQLLSYTLTVSNVGTQSATGVSVTDTLPDHTSFVSCSASCDSSALPTLTWSGLLETAQPSLTDAAAFDVGGSRELTVVVSVNATVAATVTSLTNTAGVEIAASNYQIGESDPTPENNTASDMDSLTATPDMSIVKSADLSDVAPGDAVKYSLLVANIGDQDATGVWVVDSLPLGVTVQTGSISAGGVFDAFARTITWGPALSDSGTASDPFAAGQDHTLTYVLVIDDPVAAGRHSFENSASVTDDGFNGDDPTNAGDAVDNNTSVWNLDLTLGAGGAAPDLTVTITDLDTAVQPGDVQTYAIVVTNVGNIGATGVVVTNTLPPNVSFASASCTVTPALGACVVNSDSTITVTIPTLAGAGGSEANQVTITYQVTINDPQPAGTAVKTNTVGVEDDGLNGPDPTPSNNEAADTDVLDAAPDLTVVKDDAATTRAVGDQFDYTIVVANVGNQGATGVTVHDTLPPELQLVGCDNDCTLGAGGQLDWLLGSIPGGAQLPLPTPGSSVTLTVRVRVANPLPAGVNTFSNTAVVDDDHSNGPDPTPLNNTSTDTDDVVAAPDMTIAKTDNLTSTRPGNLLTYKLTVANIGTQSATGVVVTDTLPADTLFVSCSDACDATALPIVTWSNLLETTSPGLTDEAAFDAGGTRVLTVTVRINATVADTTESISNTATVEVDSSNYLSGESDPTPANNNATDVDTLDSAPDMTIAKSDGVDRAEPGQTLTYRISVTNVGNQAATGVTVSDLLPSGLSFVSCSDACDSSALPSLTWTNLYEAGDPGDYANAFDPGGTRVVTVTVTVDSPVTAGTKGWTNTAAVVDDGTNGTDPTTANNSATDIDLYGADLAITKTDGVASTVPGTPIAYTIVVTNNGPSRVDSFTLSDAVPAAITGTRWSVSRGSFESSTGAWSGSSLSVGDTVTFDMTGTVRPDALGDLVNAATVTLPVGFSERDSANNSATDTDLLTPLARLSVNKSLEGSLVAGQNATYRITVSNTGPSFARSVAVTDVLPDGLTLVGTPLGEGWTCIDARCELNDSLAPGASASFSLVALVTARSGTITNVALASSQTPATLAPSGEPSPIQAVSADANNEVIPVTAVPVTGAEARSMITLAVAILLSGAALMTAGRRRRVTSR